VIQHHSANVHIKNSFSLEHLGLESFPEMAPNALQKFCHLCDNYGV